MPKGKPNSTSPELIEAVRDCARRKLSMKQAAAELSTSAHSLTRNAIAGVAGRAGIKFRTKGAPHSSPKPRAPAEPRVQKPTLPDPAPKSSFVIRGGQVKRSTPPPATCSWAGCTEPAEVGNIFCPAHARKPLL